MVAEARAPRVVVAEDDALVRRTVTDALQRAGITVVAAAENGREAIDLTLYHRPDAVLMDLVMPDVDGLSATRRIVSEMPDQVVVLFNCGDHEDVGLLSLRAGAVGYLSSELGADAVARAVAGAVDGEAAISRRLGMLLVERLQRPSGRR